MNQDISRRALVAIILLLSVWLRQKLQTVSPFCMTRSAKIPP